MSTRVVYFAALFIMANGGIVRSSEAAVDFVRDVRPIFEKHCYACHAGENQESGFRLDVKGLALKGGDNYGPDIVPRKPQNSPLVQLVKTNDASKRMPPEGPGLGTAEIRVLEDWIREGADWPDGVDRVELKDLRDHWSFKPVASDFGLRQIDEFIDQRLADVGLKRAEEEKPERWLRRVTFDLVGLPPSLQELDQFHAELNSGKRREEVYRRVVDRLLASPRYGERWGQAWLDLVRYADTHGFEVNTERPNAWPYRDFVICALNDDLAYDEFIRRQIVGDQLGHDAATGFLVTASVLLPGQIGKDAPSIRLARQDALDEIVNNVGQTFLALSLGCARCHDHKFDPITSRDYYAMQAFVAGVDYEDRELRSAENQKRKQQIESIKVKLQAIESELNSIAPLARPRSDTNGEGISKLYERSAVNRRLCVDRFLPVKTSRLRFEIYAANSLEPCIDELEVFNTAGTNVAICSRGSKVTASGEQRSPNRHAMEYINDGKLGNAHSWLGNEPGKGWIEVEFESSEEIDRVQWSRDRVGPYEDRLPIEYAILVEQSDSWQRVADSSDRKPWVAGKDLGPIFTIEGLSSEEKVQAQSLMKEKAECEASVKQLEDGLLVFAGRFHVPETIFVLNRGDPEQPTEEIAPRVIAALGEATFDLQSDDAKRRKGLAEWIASRSNPLTARVIVNRIWQGHFGVGLVETASDFGHNGTRPSHPELLDWLASELVRHDWSMKWLHREIALSETYRQSTRGTMELGVTVDAEDRLLWRYPTRRLEAEMIRDMMLVASGEMNFRMYGRGFDLFDKRGGLVGFNPVERFGSRGLRRMIYAHKVRREREAVFGAFDCPDAGQSTARRRESTTPIQALNLFNSPFTLDRAHSLADRLQRLEGEGEKDGSARFWIRIAFSAVFSREPTEQEYALAIPLVEQHGLEPLCRALLNANEAIYY